MARKARQPNEKKPPESFGGVFVSGDKRVELDANPAEGWQRVIVRQSLSDDWLCLYTVGNEAGVPVISELQIVPHPDSMTIPAGGIPARVLRKAKPGDALAAAREALGLVNTFDIGVDDALETYYGLSSADLDAPPRRQRSIERQRRLAGIARAYVVFAGKNSPRPVEDVADLLQRHGHSYSVSQVRNHLHDARRDGLLTSRGQGLAGGELTEKAKELLADSAS